MNLRPATLAAVADLGIRCSDEDFAMAIDEFADEFYLATGDCQGMLDTVPAPMGVARRDAWVGAVGEHMATRWGLRVPPWTARRAHFALREAEYCPNLGSMRAGLFIHSPPAFRRRMLFVPLEPLMRARFPRAERASSPLVPPAHASYLDEIPAAPAVRP